MDITNKTIFDYCKDKEVRKSIIGDYSEDYYRTFPTALKMSHLLDYAAKVNNTELFEEATKALSKAENEFEASQQAAQQDGMIIDY